MSIGMGVSIPRKASQKAVRNPEKSNKFRAETSSKNFISFGSRYNVAIRDLRSMGLLWNKYHIWYFISMEPLPNLKIQPKSMRRLGEVIASSSVTGGEAEDCQGKREYGSFWSHVWCGNLLFLYQSASIVLFEPPQPDYVGSHPCFWMNNSVQF